jgi:RNA polymerase sigma-70 factor, ECF subfamily
MGDMAVPPSSTQEPRPQSPSVTSTSLLQRIRLQDQEAWQRLVGLYGPLVYDWCRRWGMQQSDAHDTVQEVFRAVAAGIDGFQRDGVPGSFRGWLWTVAKHRASTYFSQRAQRPQVIGGTDLQARLAEIPDRCPDESISVETSSDTAELIRRALGVIQGDFQERTWRAFLRTAVDGAGSGDVADELKMTPRAVRQAKHRVLQRLREEFSDLIELS